MRATAERGMLTAAILLLATYHGRRGNHRQRFEHGAQLGVCAHHRRSFRAGFRLDALRTAP